MERPVRSKIGKSENRPYKWSDMYSGKKERAEIDRTVGVFCMGENGKKKTPPVYGNITGRVCSGFLCVLIQPAK